MEIGLKSEYGAFLTYPQPAIELCTRLLAAQEPVVLDCTGVLQMSPSFANALLFNLLDVMTAGELQQRMRLHGAAPQITQAVNRAIARKLEGKARLSSSLSQQQPHP